MEGKPHRKRQQRKGEQGIAPAMNMTERGLPNGRGTHGTNQRGQTLVEMGLTVSLCVLLTLGIVEFGYIFMALNLITQATSAGARAASVHQMGSRSLCGKITDKSAIVGAGTGTPGLVRSQISSIATVSQVTLDQVPEPKTVTPCDTFSGATIPLVIVTTTGTIPDVFGLFGSTISFTRTAQFRDEARNR